VKGLYANTTLHTESACLNCGKGLDASSVHSIEQPSRGPGDGDITICIYCRHVMAYRADLSLRPLTDAEIVDVAGDPRLVSMIDLVGAYQKDKELAARRREGRPLAGDKEASRQVHRQARRAAIAFLTAARREAARPKR
jgi:hypothetical protein